MGIGCGLVFDDAGGRFLPPLSIHGLLILGKVVYYRSMGLFRLKSYGSEGFRWRGLEQDVFLEKRQLMMDAVDKLLETLGPPS